MGFCALLMGIPPSGLSLRDAFGPAGPMRDAAYRDSLHTMAIVKSLVPKQLFDNRLPFLAKNRILAAKDSAVHHIFSVGAERRPLASSQGRAS